MVNVHRTTRDGLTQRARRAVLSWLVGQLKSMGHRLYDGTDARAAGRGWQVTQGPFGLSRTYRDQRFDGRHRHQDGGMASADPRTSGVER
jgi:hypothetical protein